MREDFSVQDWFADIYLAQGFLEVRHYEREVEEGKLGEKRFGC